MNKPAIVICAYNRGASLLRLLNLIGNADYQDSDINLIISIDLSEETSVSEIAESFVWKYGQKKVINHHAHLGLKQHILACGKLSLTYGAVIILEDDLGVSPYFYRYSKQVMDFYDGEQNIAGISLYAPKIAESCFYPFKPIDDGSDFYFMQVASSLGQLWTKQQWANFEEWFSSNPHLDDAIIPTYLKQWGPHSWKKHFIHYLIATSRFFVYPRVSLTTHFEELGTNATNLSFFQVPLQLTKKEYTFQSLNESNSIYDASFELFAKCINARTTLLSSYNYEVDLYGTKEIVENDFEYILSSKEACNAQISFSSSLIPLEANVILNLPGDKIGLYKKSENQFSKSNLTLHNYLDSYTIEKRNSISVIIPIIELNLSDLTITIDSIRSQKANVLECIIVSSSLNNQKLREFKSGKGEDLRIVITDIDHKLSSLLALGFQSATNNILTWALPGNTYGHKTFSKVKSIFKSYPMVPWIAGTDHIPAKDVDLSNTELAKYRLDLDDIYRNLIKCKLNTDTQLHFFKKHCLIDFIDDPHSLHDVFFKLYDKYQCFLVTCQLGIRSNHTVSPVSNIDLKRFLVMYSHFKKRRGLIATTFLMISNSRLFPKRLGYIIQNQIKGLPDVLRFDEHHQTFYLSKY